MPESILFTCTILNNSRVVIQRNWHISVTFYSYCHELSFCALSRVWRLYKFWTIQMKPIEITYVDIWLIRCEENKICLRLATNQQTYRFLYRNGWLLKDIIVHVISCHLQAKRNKLQFLWVYGLKLYNYPTRINKSWKYIQSILNHCV